MKKALIRVLCATISAVAIINYCGVSQFSALSSSQTIQKEIADEDDFQLTLYQNPGSEMQAIIYGYNGNCENLEIPDKLQGGTVVAIGSKAFNNCSNLKTVKLPSTVKSIGDNSFSNCTNLKSIILSNSLESIGESAFANCENLSEINIPNSVIEIDRWAFFNCKKLDSIIVPDSVTYLGSNTFAECTNLKSVVISNNLTSIENQMFYDCTSLKSVIIPQKIKEICNNAFYNCSALNTVTVSDNIENISDNAFENCNIEEIIVSQNSESVNKTMIFSKDIKKVTIPYGVKYIKDSTFSSCDKLNTITIPESVTSIGFNAFAWCENLTDITLPSKLKNIGEQAFWSCGNIKEITIPNEVETIGDGAFGATALKTLFIPESVKYCDHLFDFQSLNEITVDKNNKNYYSKDGCLFRKFDNVLLLYPHGNERTEYTIPEGTTDIDRYAFLRGTAKLKILTIPGSVKTIKNFTIYHSNLNKVILNEGVESIMKYAFVNCNFKEIYIPKSVKNIEELAFGYDNMDSVSPEKIEDFKIYGYKNTAAETYAKENDFEFIALDDEISTGDANQDGVVNVNDVTYLQRHIAGNKNTDGSALIDETNKQLFDCVDMNKDGKLSVSDVTALQIHISENN